MILHYDQKEFDFVTWARSVFMIHDLADLHRLPDPVAFANYVERLNFRVNQLKENVDKINSRLTKIKDNILLPIFGEIQKFQFPPSIRCHLSGAGTASAFHTDGEPKYGISPNSLNLWIPLTKVWGNNSLYIETGFNTGNYRALSLSPGEMVIFDAYNLSHGSFPNDTLVSRISLDIRFVPKDISIARKLGLYAKFDQE